MLGSGIRICRQVKNLSDVKLSIHWYCSILCTALRSFLAAAAIETNQSNCVKICYIFYHHAGMAYFHFEFWGTEIKVCLIRKELNYLLVRIFSKVSKKFSALFKICWRMLRIWSPFQTIYVWFFRLASKFRFAYFFLRGYDLFCLIWIRKLAELQYSWNIPFGRGKFWWNSLNKVKFSNNFLSAKTVNCFAEEEFFWSICALFSDQ